MLFEILGLFFLIFTSLFGIASLITLLFERLFERRGKIRPVKLLPLRGRVAEAEYLLCGLLADKAARSAVVDMGMDEETAGIVARMQAARGGFSVLAPEGIAKFLEKTD